MTTTPEFEQQLRRIEERATAFRTAVFRAGAAGAGASGAGAGASETAAAAGADLGAKVPSCPEWTLGDLVAHLGMVHRFWAATVAAGPADAPLREEDFDAPAPAPQELAQWSLAATEELLAALRAAGPDRGCWTWWGASDAPQTAGAVARHQVAEALVHTFDAQLAAGRTEPLPVAEALDAIDEFLNVGCGASGPWPFAPAVVALRATEGPGWLLELTPAGARAGALPAEAGAGEGAGTDAVGPDATDSDVTVSDVTVPDVTVPDVTVPEVTVPDVTVPDVTVSAAGTASELLLALYGRVPMSALAITGDAQVLDRLRVWQPSE